MSDNTVIKTLRAMAWARAVGELNALLNTYWDEDGKFCAMDQAIDNFKSEVQDNGLAE